MFGSFDISTSALTAQRLRMDTIATNIANIDSVKGADGSNQPFRRLYTVMESQRTASGGAGVRVAKIEEDQSDFTKKFEPGNPLADQQGYVKYPNVNLSTEYVNSIEAMRAYEANVTAIETTKGMITSSMRLLG